MSLVGFDKEPRKAFDCVIWHRRQQKFWLRGYGQPGRFYIDPERDLDAVGVTSTYQVVKHARQVR